MDKMNKKTLIILALGLAPMLTACGTFDRISRIGKAPELHTMNDPEAAYGNKPVIMPMPMAKQQYEEPRANSLWHANARTFFKDQRASNVGDILTVNINIADKANLSNTTKASRTSSEDSKLDNFFGITPKLGSATDGSLAAFGRDSSNKGTGTVARSETVSLTVAAIVTQVLPNGNMVIAGSQEVRINHEVRDLMISGIVRPEDIAANNTIEHTQIAQARISYGGRGVVSDVQNPKYGQELFNVLFPF